MRIYKMTATFGKLEHETLVLEPGLNVIEAPNEWGKTTWCSFLITMLYGLDTRAKTTKTALADKEKYAPWSGSPMSGRIDLQWGGRDITIERSTKGRTPMGLFRAYETASGLAVPELTASNCGQMLLGVEQSVYRRTAFIRQSDMPVTQDDALRRRLNALVTTGDETGDSDKLAEELKNLRNKCRYNRSGLLPQAEAQRKELEDKLAELESLELHCGKLRERLGEVKSWGKMLENHRDALAYAQVEADAARVAEARDVRDRTEQEMLALEQCCGKQPPKEMVERKIREIEAYQENLLAYQAEEADRSPRPNQPVPPTQFRRMTLEQAEEMLERDRKQYDLLKRKKSYLIFAVLGWIALVLCLVAVIVKEHLVAGLLGMLFVLLQIISTQKKKIQRRQAGQLEEKYGTADPDVWLQMFRNYAAEKMAFDQALLEYQGIQGDLDIKRTFLQKQQEALFAGQKPEAVLEIWQNMRKNWEAYDTACHAFQLSEQYLSALQTVVKSGVKPPVMEDALTYSGEETEKLLAEAYAEEQRLQNRLGQYQGRIEALGEASGLYAQHRAVERRIEKLENTYAALTLALDTLNRARQELQRRFAPQISARTQELLSKMTAGRYDRLMLSEDLSLLAGAGQEETLREILWRSDGTMDQLYLALRLAVAEELIPDAPLVLDDAFVRFDDNRLEEALKILEEMAHCKQVILFTCQSREKEILA